MTTPPPKVYFWAFRLTVVVEMTLEQQVERIRKRHKGNEQAVDMLKKFYDICDPAEENEPNTLAVKVTTEMTPHDVMNIILNGN